MTWLVTAPFDPFLKTTFLELGGPASPTKSTLQLAARADRI